VVILSGSRGAMGNKLNKFFAHSETTSLAWRIMDFI